MKAKRAFLYVQHLLGIGHLRRMALIANALASEGMQVTLASGGFRVPGLLLAGVRFVQLPPAEAADESFKTLVDVHRRPVDEAWRVARTRQLLEEFRAADPQILVIELFPFGRRQLRFELLPLLELCTSRSPRPLVVCSVRDILGGGQKNPQRQDEMLATFERYFDFVMVHGDPSVIPFDQTFRHAAKLGAKIHYTGYVVEPMASTAGLEAGRGDGANEVIVSAGGGAVGMRLLETAISAKQHTLLAKKTWRILCGVNAMDADVRKLKDLALAEGGEGVIVERSRNDFQELLTRCDVSVSQAGYNTMLELVSARARSVVVPYSGGGETEQSLRARAFAERGFTEMLDDEVLNPASLAAAIDRAAVRDRPPSNAIRTDGVRSTARLVTCWLKDLSW